MIGSFATWNTVCIIDDGLFSPRNVKGESGVPSEPLSLSQATPYLLCNVNSINEFSNTAHD